MDQVRLNKSFFKIISLIFNIIENGDDSSHSSNRSIGKADPHYAREPSPPTKPNQSNRDYKHVADFTGPTVTHNEVKNRIHKEI
jgi:hypothetical protein